MTAPYWIILGGWPLDGGFGDYANPEWDEEPLRRPDGTLIWFTNRETAQRFCHRLNARETALFYEHGRGGEYSGEFPYEYRPFKTYPPDGPTVADPERLADLMPLMEASEPVEPDYTDYEDEEDE